MQRFIPRDGEALEVLRPADRNAGTFKNPGGRFGSAPDLPSNDRNVTLRARLRLLAGGLTPRAVLDKFAAIQMLDVHFPTTRTLILSRYTPTSSTPKCHLSHLKDYRRRPHREPAALTASKSAS
jgi:hypothetical protein